MAKHNDIGALGEEIAAEYLTGKGMSVIERNFRRPYGEIDVIARATNGTLVFVEVKSVSWETSRGDPGSVSYETHRPEDNIHPQKLRRLSRTIEAYLAFKRYEGDWRFDVIAVFIDSTTKQARIRHTEDVVIGS